ncbi:MAG: glycosyltransferase family 4 protein [Planctomycetota bacterium]
MNPQGEPEPESDEPNPQAPADIVLAAARWFEFGGMQRTYLRIAKSLHARGRKLKLCVSRWDGPHPDFAELREFGVEGLSNHERNAAFAKNLAAEVAKSPRALVVGFTKVSGLDLYYAADPCFNQRVSAATFGFARRLLPRYRELIRQEQAVFAQGEKTQVMLIAHGQQQVFQRYYQTESERFHLMPPGIDRVRLDEGLARPFSAAAFRESLGLKPSDRVFLTLGSGFKTKGVDRTLRALSRIPVHKRQGLVFVVVGEGKVKALERQADLVGVPLVATGPRADVVDFYRAAECLLHPARVENTGTSLIEAMYCGLPVLCTENCGFADHVRAAGAGTVMKEPFDLGRYTLALEKRLLAEDREALAAAGRAYTREHDLYGLIEAAADLIEAQADAKAVAISS